MRCGCTRRLRGCAARTGLPLSDSGRLPRIALQLEERYFVMRWTKKLHAAATLSYKARMTMDSLVSSSAESVVKTLIQGRQAERMEAQSSLEDKAKGVDLNLARELILKALHGKCA